MLLHTGTMIQVGIGLNDEDGNCLSLDPLVHRIEKLDKKAWDEAFIFLTGQKAQMEAQIEINRQVALEQQEADETETTRKRRKK